MEGTVGKLTGWASSGPDWPYALVQLHEGTCHVPLLNEGHLGILPQRGVEVTPLWMNQPTGSLPTPHHWPTSCLPNRVEQM